MQEALERVGLGDQGKARRPRLALIAQAHPLQSLLHPLSALAALDPAIDQGRLDVVGDAEVLDQVEVLEDEADGVVAQPRQAGFRNLGHLFAAEPVAARARPIEQAQDVEQGGLAASRRPGDGDEFAGGDFQRNALQGLRLDLAVAIGPDHVFELEHA